MGSYNMKSLPCYRGYEMQDIWKIWMKDGHKRVSNWYKISVNQSNWVDYVV